MIRTIAVTGGSGFIGRRLLATAVDQGIAVRALTRRPAEPWPGVNWVDGSLEDSRSLTNLVSGADSVIHVAGVIKGFDAQDFERGNVEGTRAMLAAAADAGVRRFVHVSSLAAREPGLSLYGASKARSEELVRDSGLDWAIVRPPAVYGPGDREMLELFRMARRGIVFLPPSGGKLSLIHADDLVGLLIALAEPDAPGGLIVEPDDGRPGGWTHRQFGKALAGAVGRRAICVSTPRVMLHAGARIDSALRGQSAKLTVDRAAYFAHPDWVAAADRAVPDDLWRPSIPTDQGLLDTARWYRREGWL